MEMWEYGDVGIWRCGDMEMRWQSADVGTLECVDMEMGGIERWGKIGNMEMGGIERWGKIGNMEMRWLSADVGYWDMGIGRCGNIGIWG